MDVETLKRYRYNRLELQRLEMQIEDMDGDLEPRATQITGLPSAHGQEHDARMIAMMRSMLSVATLRPSKMWARFSAFARSKRVRRSMTSHWKRR